MDKMNVDAYMIGRMIGKGTFGEVYKAEHKHTKDLAAMKIIDMKPCAKKDKEHMYQEIAMLRRCNHDNLVQYKDSFDKGRYMYIVMELCTEGSLREYIQTNHGLEEDMCILVLRHVSSGINYLHQQNIVHRDVKTTNIFLTKQSDNVLAKIGDFGLARVLDVSSIPTLTVGSPYFMSPEMIEGKEYGKPTDIWSLGCCVYEMATTNIPFEASKIDVLKRKIIEGELVIDVIQYCTHIKQMVQSMMSQKPEDRPEIATLLNFLLSHNHGNTRTSSHHSNDTEANAETVMGRKSKVKRKHNNFSKTWSTGDFGKAKADSSGYDSSSREQADECGSRYVLTVKVSLNEEEMDIYKKAQLFETDVRKCLGADADVVMKQVNEAIKTTKQMESNTVFMTNVETIIDNEAIFKKCKLNLQCLWAWKKELLLRNFAIEW